ncbi:MAG: hypothetical protein WB565_01010 [Acidimicrobiales bacterium]
MAEDLIDVGDDGVIDGRENMAVDVAGDSARRVTHPLLEQVVGRPE